MSLYLFRRQLQAFPFSSAAESTVNVDDLPQLWQEVVVPAAEESSVDAEAAYHASRIRRAIQIQSLSQGKKAHLHVVFAGLDHVVLLGNLLVQMYGFSGALQDATAIFERMRLRDASSWSLLIKSYARYNHLAQALHLFSRMQCETMHLDNACIGSLLSACSGKDKLSIVRLLHFGMVERCLVPSVSVTTAFLSLYGKSGCLQDAEQMFDTVHERDVVCWNAMIAAFVSAQSNIKAFCLYHKMISEGYKPERSTFLSILTACASQKDVTEGRLVHICTLEYGLELDVGVANALVNMYGDCYCLEDAQDIFDGMSATNVVSWNSMIAELVHNGRDGDALVLFERMQRNAVTPSNVTFINAISACSNPVYLEQGQLLYHFVLHVGLDFDVVIMNALVNMFGKCGEIRDAKLTFENSNSRDVVSWTSMLTLYSANGQGQEALQMFDQMQIEGFIPDRVTFMSLSVAYTSKVMLHKCRQIHSCILNSVFARDINLNNSLITMYGKCCNTEFAYKIFKRMPKRDLMTWNAIFSAYVQNGLAEAALSLLNTMGCENIMPDEFLCSSILSACAAASIQEQGKKMHSLVVINAFDGDLTIGNSLLNMYGKFGNLDDALGVFERMPSRDIVSWSAVIGAFAQQGEAKIAVDLYSKLQEEKVTSDKIALVHLLSACSRGGLVDEGLRHFLALANDENGELIVNHFNCMVDLLTRAGRLDEAEQLLLKLPLKSSAVAWTTLLGACRSQVDLKRGEFAASRIFELAPHDAAPHVTLSNLYFAAGKLEEAFEVILRMKSLGLGKEIDNSAIDVLAEANASCIRNAKE